MLRHGRRYKPVLLGAETSEQQQVTGTFDVAAQYEFTATVHYINTDGNAATWSGSFFSADPFTAEGLGREFVIKYMQPQSITDALALPVGFTLTPPTFEAVTEGSLLLESGDNIILQDATGVLMLQ